VQDPTPTSHGRYFDPVCRCLTELRRPGSVPVPALDGTWSTDTSTLSWAAEDFGRSTRHRPLAVVRPGSPDDIGTVLRFAGTHGIPVVPRAEGHSTGGQAQALDGIVLDLRGFDTVHDVSRDRVVVGAGARWSTVLAATLPHGLTPPVLTDYLEMSVGGTLSVGGIGGASHHFGAQTDNVLSLDAYTPDGTPVTCSPTTNPHLFDALRGGRGRHGVILRATLRLVPAHTHARNHRLRYDRLDTFLADQRGLVAEGRFHHLEGQARRDTTGTWRYQLDATAYFTPPAVPPGHRLLDGLADRRPAMEVNELTYRRFAHRMAEDVALLRRLGPWRQPHPWINLLLPDHATEPFLTETFADLAPQDLGETGVVLVYPVPRKRFTTPRLRLPDTPTVFLLSLLRTAPPDSPAELRRMIAANRVLLRRAVHAGGNAYLDEIQA
jgi:cytokinin dehydrogenase